MSGDTLLSDLRINVRRGGHACQAYTLSLTTCRPDPARAPFLSRSHCQMEVGCPAVLDCPPELSSVSAPRDRLPAKWPSYVVVAGLIPADFHHSLNTNSRKRSLPQLASLFPLGDPPIPRPGSRGLPQGREQAAGPGRVARTERQPPPIHSPSVFLPWSSSECPPWMRRAALGLLLWEKHQPRRPALRAPPLMYTHVGGDCPPPPLLSSPCSVTPGPGGAS